jgi:TolB-like protein/DNA-binding winged helix-turn-helix (wHTH) protein/Tfp pilus assembly protein PilF
LATSAQSPGRVRFDGFEVDLRSGEIWENGARVRLQDQPFQILRVLLERNGEIVTREELKRTLWPADTFVDFDDGLNTAVKKIRDILGDSAEQTRYIETIPRRGYRFKSPIERQSPPEAEPASAPNPQLAVTSPVPEAAVERRTARLAAFVAVGAIALITILVGAEAGGWRARLFAPVAAPRIESLAVLPLANLSHDPEQDYFADGMTETLIADLAQVSALRVISRTSAMHYKGSNKTLPQIARDLNVDAVIEGSVQRSGDRVRVTAKLIPAQTDAPVWAKIYERDARDVLLMQSELAQAIVGEIKIQLTPRERQHLASARPINPDAHDAYLLGNYHASKRNPASLAKGIEYFQRAIRVDPTYAEAYAGLANAYFEREIWGGLGINKLSVEIRANTLKALELDPDLPEAHVLLGRIHFQSDWDWPSTEAEFKRAIELNPNLASAYVYYAYFLQAMGRNPEALAAAHRAVELDPLSAPNICDEGRILYRARQFDNAVERYQRALELDPSYVPALWRMADAYEQLTRFEVGLSYARKAQEITGSRIAGLRPLARIYASMGKRREALEAAKAIEEDGTLGGKEYALTVVYSALGDRDRAIKQLEKGVRMRSLPPFVFVEPQLDGIRSDPRFQQLRHRAGLPS